MQAKPDISIRNSQTWTHVDENGDPVVAPPNSVVMNDEDGGGRLRAGVGASRADRRRAARALARERISEAVFVGADDRRIHIARRGKLKTVCGRAGRNLPATANVHKDRCPTCAKELA